MRDVVGATSLRQDIGLPSAHAVAYILQRLFFAAHSLIVMRNGSMSQRRNPS